MKKQPKILPIGLKGQEVNERMRELMGIKPINESKTNIVVELTKMGPDGYPYAIIRENHEWFIKKASKTTDLVAEDFKYIGGLMNKHSEGYPSYAKATKHLNLKFKSLAEACGFTDYINVLENDNLLNESGIAGFSSDGKSGFSGEGNLEGNKPMTETEEPEEENVEMTEAEEAIDKMLEEEKTEDSVEVSSADKPQKTEDGVEFELKSKVTESKLTIKRAMANMDSIIDTLTEGTKKKVYTLM